MKLTDFRLKDGVFRAEGVVLKKVVTAIITAKTQGRQGELEEIEVWGLAS